MSTGVVKIGSDLVRRKWMREGLVQASSKSFWDGYSGNSKKSIVFVAKNESAKEGHTVVFDFDGNLSGKAVKGKETAFGKGEQKKKFSDKCTVERYRLPVDNGDSFDGVNIGDLNITQHSDSRAKLGDLWVRWKDQALFDAAQGLIRTNDDAVQAPTTTYDTGTEFTIGTLTDIERNIRTGRGFTPAGVRRPPAPFMVETVNGKPRGVWLFVIDAFQEAMLRKDTAGWRTIIKDGDYRGSRNRNLSGVIGRVGQLLVVTADTFFGATLGSGAGFGLDDTSTEIAGLRQFDDVNNVWSGQEGFDYTSTIKSRGLVLGAGALQMAYGKMPDYRFQQSEDFGIKSESALEVWCEARKTVLKAENKDYNEAKVANTDFGVITIDTQVQTA